MKCKNCGKEMIWLIELTTRNQIWAHICPSVSVAGVKTSIGPKIAICCTSDEKKMGMIEKSKKKTGKLRMECKNCGQEMIGMLEFKTRERLTYYLCPSAPMVVVKGAAGIASGAIYCNSEKKKEPEKKPASQGEKDDWLSSYRPHLRFP